ncbi:glycosyltransferase family 25 protein [Acetobacter estunensis]|nr:glycosyltransferase family 25 protein [Acetobacter estunensis]
MTPPHKHVISLARHGRRRDAFFRNNPHLSDVNVFSAVDGWALSRPELVAQGIIAPENTYVEPALGVLMSHVTLWREAVTRNVPLTIMEDDVIVREDFDVRTCALMAEHDECDAVFWGANTDWPLSVRLGGGLPDATLLFDETTGGKRALSAQSESSPTLMRVLGLAGICCYTVSPQGAQRLLDRALPVGNIPAHARHFEAGIGVRSHPINWQNTGLDVEISRQAEALDMWVCLPFLATSPNDWAESSFERKGHVVQA